MICAEKKKLLISCAVNIGKISGFLMPLLKSFLCEHYIRVKLMQTGQNKLSSLTVLFHRHMELLSWLFCGLFQRYRYLVGVTAQSFK